MLYTLEQKPVEVDRVFNASAATELDNTPESIIRIMLRILIQMCNQTQIHPLNMNQNKVLIQDQVHTKQIYV